MWCRTEPSVRNPRRRLELVKCCKTAGGKEADVAKDKPAFCSRSETSRPCTALEFGTHCTCSQTARFLKKNKQQKQSAGSGFKPGGGRKSKNAVIFLQRRGHGDRNPDRASKKNQAPKCPADLNAAVSLRAQKKRATLSLFCLLFF